SSLRDQRQQRPSFTGDGTLPAARSRCHVARLTPASFAAAKSVIRSVPSLIARPLHRTNGELARRHTCQIELPLAKGARSEYGRGAPRAVRSVGESSIEPPTRQRSTIRRSWVDSP